MCVLFVNSFIQGVALTKVPKIKHVIIIGGAKFPAPTSVAQNAYASPLQCPSLHFLGTYVNNPNLPTMITPSLIN